MRWSTYTMTYCGVNVCILVSSSLKSVSEADVCEDEQASKSPDGTALATYELKNFKLLWKVKTCFAFMTFLIGRLSVWVFIERIKKQHKRSMDPRIDSPQMEFYGDS